MNHFQLRHSMSLRMPLELFQWIRAQSNEEGLPPATYTVRRLAELARQDLQQGEVDGDLHVGVGE